MTLISSIINDAYRESNAIPLGKDPTDNQVTEALRLYNQLLAGIYGGDAGERLTDWPLGYFDRQPNAPQCLTLGQLQRPNINRRMIAVNDAAIQVYLTPYPQDGSRMGIVDPFGRLAAFPVTINANGRTIENTPTIVLNTDGLERDWIYRSDLGGWVRISHVIATDENPFPFRFDSMFSILLAMRLNPRYGRTLDEQSIASLKESRQQFVARYLQSQPLEIDDSISWPFMSTQGYDVQRQFSSNAAFDRGSYPWGGR